MTLQNDVAQLLAEAEAGSVHAHNRLFALVYDELRALAHHYLGRERGPRTLSTTSIVHEAYLKLFERSRLPVRGRTYFFGAAARAMRQILVEHARRRKALKRGDAVQRVDLDAREIAIDACAADLLELDDALERLAALDERQARIVEYRFFAGLSVEETAEVLNVSARTVKRDWQDARLWLYCVLHGERPPD